MIQKVEAVVIRTMNYGESSKILTLYTRETGTLGVLVKGARGRKNKFGASLEPLAHISAVVYNKEARELQLLTDAELINDFRSTQEDFEKLFLSFSILELTYMVTRHAERNEELFDLLVTVLSAIDSATNPVLLLFYYFETRVIEILGFSPSISACSACGGILSEYSSAETERVIFSNERGTFTCGECLEPEEGHFAVSGNAVRLWEQLPGMNVKEISGVVWNEGLQGELDRLITGYLGFHQPGMRSLKSKRIFESLKNRE